ncbi:hypothetical protein WJX82_002274 [Trebouxia sp. C0006]
MAVDTVVTFEAVQTGFEERGGPAFKLQGCKIVVTHLQTSSTLLRDMQSVFENQHIDRYQSSNFWWPACWQLC